MATNSSIWNFDAHDIHAEAVRNTALAAKKPPSTSFLSRFSLSSSDAPKATINKPISKLDRKRFQASVVESEHPLIMPGNDQAYSRNPCHNPYYSAALLGDNDDPVTDVSQETRRVPSPSPIGSRPPPPPYEPGLPDSYKSLAEDGLTKDKQYKSKFQWDTASTDLVPISSSISSSSGVPAHASGSYPPEKQLQSQSSIPIIILPPSPSPEPRYPYPENLPIDMPTTMSDLRPNHLASVPDLSAAVKPVLGARSLTAPAETPLLPTHINRRAARRAPPTDPTMDRIDELDESNPLGMPIHHGGPYEAILKNLAPAPKIKSKEEKRKLVHPVWDPYTVGVAPGEIPDERRVQEPIPVGIVALNLSPGQVLPHKVLKTGHTLRLPRPPLKTKSEVRGPLIMQMQPTLPTADVQQVADAPHDRPAQQNTPAQLISPVALTQAMPQARSHGYRNHTQPPRMAVSRSLSQRTAFDAERGPIPPRHQQLQLQQQLQTQLQIAALTGQPPFVQAITLPHNARRVSPSTPPRRQFLQSQPDVLGQDLFLRSEQQRIYSGDGSPTPSVYSLSDAYAADAFYDETQSSIAHSESSRGSHQIWRGMESASQTSHSSMSHEPMSAVSDQGQHGRPWDHGTASRMHEHAQRLYDDNRHEPKLDRSVEPISDRGEQRGVTHPPATHQPAVSHVQRPFPNHVPKHLVMPAPLQGSQPPIKYQVPPDVPMHVNDSNKLRKRVSIAGISQDLSKEAKSRMFSDPTGLDHHNSSSQIARAQSERISSTSDSSKDRKKLQKRVLSKRR